MKWTESTVTKLLITDVKSLDPVTVYLENWELGRGKVTIEVFGESWSAGWGAMGARTVEQFILCSDNHYLSKNLATLAALSEEDFSGFVDNIKRQLIEGRKAGDWSKESARDKWDKLSEIEPEKEWFHDSSNHELLYCVAGPEWWYSIPSVDSSLFKYLCRILDALKACLRERETKIAA